MHSVVANRFRALGLATPTLRACLSTQYDFQTLFQTNHQQLPRLTIPDINDTVRKYLNSVEHLCESDGEFRRVQSGANDFLSGVGPELQQKLLEKDSAFAGAGEAAPAFYFEKAWDEGYLGARCPNPVNINPFYIIKRNASPDMQGRVDRTAHLVESSVKWQLALLDNKVMPEKSGACIATLGRQMGTARIPEESMDCLKESPSSKHVVFQWQNDFYRVDVVDAQGTLASVNSIKSAIQEITSIRKSDSQGSMVGVLTTSERNSWAKIRKDMVASNPTNAVSLDTIDEALMIIALDDEDLGGLDDVGMAMLTGDGKNRWFDKHQIIVLKDGTVGVNFEHSHSDGTTWNRMIHEVWHDMESKGQTSAYGPLPDVPQHTSPLAVQAVEFALSDSVADEISKCCAEFDKVVRNIDLKMLMFDDFAKPEIKAMKMSPDAVGQMAFQMSYFKLHDKLGPTYESCSTRGFFRGRTETIRACSEDMATFVTAMAKKDSFSKSELCEMMHRAASRHVTLAKEAMMGLGCDRHMMALKIIAEEEGYKMPEIFNDPVYSRSQTFLLSSSNVSSPELDVFGFGAVTGDGYGIGYQILQDVFPICVTSYHDSPSTNTTDFVSTVSQSLHDLRGLAREA